MLFEKNPFNQYRKFTSVNNLFSNNYQEYVSNCSIQHSPLCLWLVAAADVTCLQAEWPGSNLIKQNWVSKCMAHVSENPPSIEGLWFQLSLMTSELGQDQMVPAGQHYDSHVLILATELWLMKCQIKSISPTYWYSKGICLELRLHNVDRIRNSVLWPLYKIAARN